MTPYTSLLVNTANYCELLR